MFSIFILPTLSPALLGSSSFFRPHSTEPGSLKASPWAKICQSCLCVIPSSLCFSPTAHAVTSESSGEITATGRLQPGITSCWDGPTTQQGTENLCFFILCQCLPLSFYLSFTLFLPLFLTWQKKQQRNKSSYFYSKRGIAVETTQKPTSSQLQGKNKQVDLCCPQDGNLIKHK